MGTTIEYRVVPVTRFLITKHRVRDDGSADTGDIVEVDSMRKANSLAEALAAREPYALDGSQGVEVKVVAFDQPPGRAMRCKVRLNSKLPQAWLHSGPNAPGRSEIRLNSQDREYTWADPTDPLNYRLDGERLVFSAVWESPAADSEDRANACAENRIFTDATPSINFDAVVRNRDVLERLTEGGEYYVDFIPAPKAAS